MLEMMNPRKEFCRKYGRNSVKLSEGKLLKSQERSWEGSNPWRDSEDISEEVWRIVGIVEKFEEKFWQNWSFWKDSDETLEEVLTKFLKSFKSNQRKDANEIIAVIWMKSPESI